MNHVEWALIPEFPHPSIIEDLVLIPTPADLPRWLESYDADKATREVAIEALNNGGGWETIRLAIEPHAGKYEEGYSDLYRQVVFRSLGTDEKTINAESGLILSEYLISLKIFTDKHAFQPGQLEAIFKIFEEADKTELFENWLICHLHISFCELSLPFPIANKHKLDPIVKICKPLRKKHPLQPLPKRFDLASAKKLLNEQIIYKHRFRLFEIWKWIEKEIMRKVDPTGIRFVKANLPFMMRHDSDKKAATAAKKAIKAEAVKSGFNCQSGGLILAQCVYCYQLRVESLPSGNGVVKRHCSNCGELEKKFWTIWKK
jgi:hypothetical protein